MSFDPRRHALPLAALWWLVVTIAMVAVRAPTPVDETRYLTVAWEMWQSGDWVSLKLNGAPYGHKPPLLFWLVNLGWSVFGTGVWWPRLMLAGFALGALALTHRLARQMVPGNDAVPAMTVLITASSLYWLAFTAAVMFDLLLAFFVLVAVSAVVAASRGSGWRAWILVGLALGAGILTKGPVALLLVLPLALLAPWWVETPPPTRWRAWYGGIALAVVIGAAVALAWAVPTALAAGSSFGREIFWSQSAGRMVGGAAPHSRPFWFYLPGLVVLAWPWVVWPKVWRGLAVLRRGGAPGVRFALAWCLPPIVGFSAFSGKQIHYLLPVLPGIALLAASGLSALGTSPWRRSAAVPAAAFVALAAGVVWFGLQPRAAAVIGPGSGVAAAITAAGLLAAAVLMLAAQSRAPASAVALIGSAAVIGLLGALLGLGRAYLAPRDLQPVADILAKAQAAEQPIAHLGKYHGVYQFQGRLKRPIEVMNDLDSLRRWGEAHPEGRVITQAYKPMVHREGRQPLISQSYMGRSVYVWRGADVAGLSPELKRERGEEE